jgi:hypothetical protein
MDATTERWRKLHEAVSSTARVRRSAQVTQLTPAEHSACIADVSNPLLTLAPAGPVLAGVFRGRATAAAYASIGDAERSGPPLP